MKIENVKLTDLHPLENNVRRHGENQISELVKSLEQFGQTRAFVVDEKNNILIGNGMYEAMKRMGAESVAAYRVKGLSEARKKKLILSDNKVFSLGSDDFSNIESYIHEITADGDFDIAGFDEEALKALTRNADEVLSDVMSYGKVDTLKSKPAESAPEMPSPAHETPVYAAQVANSTGADAYNSGVDPAETIKTVVCPSCGEIIRL